MTLMSAVGWGEQNSDAGVAQRLNPYLHMVRAVDGQLTREIHEAFWNELRSSVDPEYIPRLTATMRANLSGTEAYALETWRSAKLSSENKTPIKTLALISIENSLTEEFGQTLGFPKGTNEYDTAMKAFNASDTFEKVNELLRAAASDDYISSPAGEATQITSDLINSVLAGMEASNQRVKRLLDPVWRE